MDGINEILENLSEDDISRLKNLAGDLLGGNNADNASAGGQNSQSDSANNTASSDFLDPETIKRMANIMSALKNNPGTNERTNFIASLKPMLSEKRQQKADEAMKMISLFDILPALKDSGLF